MWGNKKPDDKVSNQMKKGLPENKGVIKSSYTNSRASFDESKAKLKPKADFTEVEDGLKIMSSDQDEFMNVVMTSDDDSFNKVKVQEQKGFEEPTKVEANQTTVKSDITKTATATTTTGSKAPLVVGLGILAYLGFSK